VSVETIKRIKDAEKQAEEMQKQAHIKARDLVKQAEEEAILILRRQEEQARKDADALLLRARQEAEQEIGKSLKEDSQRQCDHIRQAAGKYIPEAVALVMGRMVNLHGDS
jgi:V/A-type H+-transporting ATPase subunit G/H